MMDEQTRELIQAGVDGELDLAGEAELARLLQTSDEARDYHSQLQRLAEILDRIPDQEPPAGLHARIMQGINLPARQTRKSLFSVSEAPPLLRYGFAGAAALVLAIAIAVNREDLGDPADISSMVGTMTRPVQGQAPDIVDQFTVNAEAVSGTVTLERRDGAMVMNVELEAAQDFELNVNFSGNGLELDAFAQLDSRLDTISYADEILTVKGQGRQQFVLMLNPGEMRVGEHRSRIDLVIKQQGAQVRSGSLELGGV